MHDEITVLKMVAQRLENVKIPYMITGSIAANFYAVPRMTRDIDIVIEVKQKNVSQIVTAFKKDFYIDPDMVSNAISEQGMFNIIHNDSVMKVDFIVRKSSEYRAVEFGRRRQEEVEGQKIWIVSAEDLVLSKLFWAKDSMSEMQLGDVKNILRGRDVDLKYIERWVQELHLDEIYKKVRYE